MPPHRRFSYPGLEVQELLQLGSFSTASEACCACGALEQMGPGGYRGVADYGLNDLLDLDTHGNPLAACGWGACSRGSSGSSIINTPANEICSVWGQGPAPASGRCLSRCSGWPACCGTEEGCDCDETPRARELSDFRQLGVGSSLDELLFYGHEHGYLDRSSEGRPCTTSDFGDGSGDVDLLPSPSPSSSASPSPSPGSSSADGAPAPMWDLLSHNPAAVHERERNIERVAWASAAEGGGARRQAMDVPLLGHTGRWSVTGGGDEEPPLVTEVYPDPLFPKPPPPNATECTYLRVCAMVLNLGGLEPRLSALQTLVRRTPLPIELQTNYTIHYWELYFEKRTHKVGHAYGQFFPAKSFAAKLERGEIDLENAAEVYALEDQDVNMILRLPLLRDDAGRFVWERRVATMKFHAKLIAIGGGAKTKPRDANMPGKRKWAAPMWAKTIRKAATEKFDDPDELPPPPPPDLRTPPPEPPPAPSPSPPASPAPLDMSNELHDGLVAHDHMQQMINALKPKKEAPEEGEEAEDDKGKEKEEKPPKGPPTVLVVFAGPLDLPDPVPPRWRPRTKVVRVDKTRVELMSDICDEVASSRATLNRLAGTDSAGHPGVMPAAGPAQKTSVRGPLRNDARVQMPPILSGAGVRRDGGGAAAAAASPLPSPSPSAEVPWWRGDGSRRRSQAQRQQSVQQEASMRAPVVPPHPDGQAQPGALLHAAPVAAQAAAQAAAGGSFFHGLRSEHRHPRTEKPTSSASAPKPATMQEAAHTVVSGGEQGEAGSGSIEELRRVAQSLAQLPVSKARAAQLALLNRTKTRGRVR